MSITKRNYIKKIKPNYKKISDNLEEMMYSVFSCYGNQNINQLPIIIDALSYFIATADGNAFSITSKDGKKHNHQYYNDARQILELGIKAYMFKNGLDKISYNDTFGLANSLNVVLDELSKKEK